MSFFRNNPNVTGGLNLALEHGQRSLHFSILLSQWKLQENSDTKCPLLDASQAANLSAPSVTLQLQMALRFQLSHGRTQRVARNSEFPGKPSNARKPFLPATGAHGIAEMSGSLFNQRQAANRRHVATVSAGMRDASSTQSIHQLIGTLDNPHNGRRRLLPFPRVPLQPRSGKRFVLGKRVARNPFKVREIEFTRFPHALLQAWAGYPLTP
jgi:hypothetical protein